MTKLTLLACLLLLLFVAPVSAQRSNCWWTPGGYVCHPGWSWRDGRAWSDYEWRERERRPREEWHEHHNPHYWFEHNRD